jgi:hypothetical protein
MKIWFDTEFIEDGHTIDLISIGMIRQDGNDYYAESSECDLSKANEWVREHVLPQLTNQGKSRARIREEILCFAGLEPEFWAYYGAYDWVALCQLFGRMIDLPKGWPMWCRDVKQACESVGNPKLPPQTGEHNALADARWTQLAFEELILKHGLIFPPR